MDTPCSGYGIAGASKGLPISEDLPVGFGNVPVMRLPIPILKYILSVSQAPVDGCMCPSMPRGSSGVFQRCFGSKWGREAWSKHHPFIKMPALVQLCFSHLKVPSSSEKSSSDLCCSHCGYDSRAKLVRKSCVSSKMGFCIWPADC